MQFAALGVADADDFSHKGRFFTVNRHSNFTLKDLLSNESKLSHKALALRSKSLFSDIFIATSCLAYEMTITVIKEHEHSLHNSTARERANAPSKTKSLNQRLEQSTWSLLLSNTLCLYLYNRKEDARESLMMIYNWNCPSPPPPRWDLRECFPSKDFKIIPTWEEWKIECVIDDGRLMKCVIVSNSIRLTLELTKASRSQVVPKFSVPYLNDFLRHGKSCLEGKLGW